jgi:hypothetical protein
MPLIRAFAPKVFLNVSKPVVAGSALQLIGIALSVYGYFATGHPSLVDWRAMTPWWFADWLPNIEAEIGMVLIFAGMIPLYWPVRR